MGRMKEGELILYGAVGVGAFYLLSRLGKGVSIVGDNLGAFTTPLSTAGNESAESLKQLFDAQQAAVNSLIESFRNTTPQDIIDNFTLSPTEIAEKEIRRQGSNAITTTLPKYATSSVSVHDKLKFNGKLTVSPTTSAVYSANLGTPNKESILYIGPASTPSTATTSVVNRISSSPIYASTTPTATIKSTPSVSTALKVTSTVGNLIIPVSATAKVTSTVVSTAKKVGKSVAERLKGISKKKK